MKATRLPNSLPHLFIRLNERSTQQQVGSVTDLLTVLLVVILEVVSASVHIPFTKPSGEMASADPDSPRWAAAAVYIPSPPSIVLFGGKTDLKTGQSYSSAPSSHDLLLLPLNRAELAYTRVNVPASPAAAWHSLTFVGRSEGPTYDLLLLGGDSETSASCLINLNPSNLTAHITDLSTRWGTQPSRRTQHSVASHPGSSSAVYITGGRKADGSGSAFSDVYRFDLQRGFEPLPDLPRGVFHHLSVLLPNGTLLVLGGAGTSPDTGKTVVLPLSTIYRIDIASASLAWSIVTVQTLAPQGRRGAAAALIGDGYTLFITGGADAGLQQVFADSWTLDLTNLTWRQVGGLGARESRALMDLAVILTFLSQWKV